MALFLVMGSNVFAQTSAGTPLFKAWEFGVGASVFQFNRISLSNFSQGDDGGYVFDLKLNQTVYGGNLYVARELTNFLYFDLQGTLGATSSILNSNKTHWLFMFGPGVQWRFGNHLLNNPRYIEPYLRAGINYMHKSFEIMYDGAEGLDNEQMKWFLNNISNKDGADKRNLIPIALGFGVHMWLNDNWGIGMQGDYLVMPHKNVANSLQGTIRAMYRWGESKAVDQCVRKVTQGIKGSFIFEDTNFDFNKAVIKPEAYPVLDELAQMIKDDYHTMFMITGYTDILGNDEYNQKLSSDRAEAVAKALIERGVSPQSLKFIGVGSKVAHARDSDSDEVRGSDRKITIEPISDRRYWDRLPRHNLTR